MLKTIDSYVEGAAFIFVMTEFNYCDLKNSTWLNVIVFKRVKETDLSLYGMMLLKGILNKQDVKVWIGFNWIPAIVQSAVLNNSATFLSKKGNAHS